MTSDPPAAGGPSSQVELEHGAISFRDALVIGPASAGRVRRERR